MYLGIPLSQYLAAPDAVYYYYLGLLFLVYVASQ